MIKRIIKRDGTVERFDIIKPGNWLSYGAKGLDPDLADISGILIEAYQAGQEEMHSQEFQKLLITIALSRGTDTCNRLAGTLYACYIHKNLFNGDMPHLKDFVKKLQDVGLMDELPYTEEEYEKLNAAMDHERDKSMRYYQIQHILVKYGLADTKLKKNYESPQYTCMRMALALASTEPEEIRVQEAINFYEEFSNGRVNGPTPNWRNLGTFSKGLASCCLYAVTDTARSIAVGHTIVETMTYMSAGIGGKSMIRSIGDPVRKGAFLHQGKQPYQVATRALTKANLQGSRGGASTDYIDCFDPEIRTMVMYQNPRTPEDKKIRGMHFAVIVNPFFVDKALKGEKIFTFNCKTAPDLYKAFSEGNEDLFVQLYAKYEQDDSFVKNYDSAREILLMMAEQYWEVSTVYTFNIEEANKHTPYKEPIHSSNLCLEICNPTKPYEHMMDLFTEDHHKGEVGLCSIGGVVYTKIKENDDEQYLKTCIYALKMIDWCIHNSYYELPHVGYTAKQRMNASVGLLDVAYHMARKGLTYNSHFGYIELHKIAERHAYFMIKAALILGKERGNAPWIDKTKWPEGWLPIDTYNKNVDTIAPFKLRYDWEELRAAIIENGGIRFSSLIAHMPTEASSKAAGAMNGLYPARMLSMIKTDGTNAVEWCAPESDTLGQQYQLAWELTPVEMFKIYGIFQKFCDQSISADIYRDRRENVEIKHSELLDEVAAQIYYGVKSRYYTNSLTVDTSDEDAEIDAAFGIKSNKVADMGNNGSACGAGGCTL